MVTDMAYCTLQFFQRTNYRARMLQFNFSEGQRPMSKRSKVKVTDSIALIRKVHFLQFIVFFFFLNCG